MAKPRKNQDKRPFSLVQIYRKIVEREQGPPPENHKKRRGFI
jgi:hypothetical protein